MTKTCTPIKIRRQKQIEQILREFSAADTERLWHDWVLQARHEQLPPSLKTPWSLWLFMGGRGAGKTRAGAEWVRGLALGIAPFAHQPVGRIALVGETHADVREVMLEGVSGLLAIHPRLERPHWHMSRRLLVWPNGAQAQLFSAEDPESLRGPQFDAAWSDEIGKWRYGEETWDMLQFAVRLGSHPRQMATTTPRSVPLLKRLLAEKTTLTTHASTYANAAHLAKSFLEGVSARYEGTRLARQELDGHMVEDRNDALWSRQMIADARVRTMPALRRLVVAVDPCVSSGANADHCGIIAAALGDDDQYYVLEDASVQGVKPDVWAQRALSLAERLNADALIAESNQGGELIASVFAAIGAHRPITPVRATRSKWLRAEPVAALYAQGKVHHVGVLSALEDELCDFGPQGLSSGRSPDRLDALVWALTALGAGQWQTPRMRQL